MIWPAMMKLCSDPGRSIRTTLVCSGSVTAGMVFSGMSLGAQSSNNASRCGVISARFVSPTTIIVALFGRNQVE